MKLLFLFGCLLLLLAAPQARADEPQRLLLPGIPKPRFNQDGYCPFTLCLQSCAEFLGRKYAYDYLLGAAGTCFRLTWDTRELGGGPMHLAILGPAPFRHGFAAAGLQPRFLVKRDWWPEATGLDLTRLEDNQETEATFRQRILRSLRGGKPVLAFGVVGPPEQECLITGYDEGGEVLIGWNEFQDVPGPSAGVVFEPTGEFRQRGWFPKTSALMLIDQVLDAPAPAQVYREAVAWAYRVSTLPKSSPYVFGPEAYKEWAEALLRDADFPTNDDRKLQTRRDMLYDSLIMLYERGSAAAFLSEAAASWPEAAPHLREASRLFAEERDLCAQVQKPLGGTSLPAASFTDPVARRTALDYVLTARERNREALNHLAGATGQPPVGGFAGTRIENLFPRRRWMTVMGSFLGCVRYLGKDYDDAWVYGLTGAAFMLNIDKNVDVSGPTSWDHQHVLDMAPYLGVSMAQSVRGRDGDANFAGQCQAARPFLETKVKAGTPCFGFDGWFEYFTVAGYNDREVAYWTHYADGNYMKKPWDQVGHNDCGSFEFVAVEPASVKGNDRAAIKAALVYALQIGHAAPAPDGSNAQGLAGYDSWIRCLENGDWRKPELPGVHHNTACWHESRAYAERFLRLAGAKLGGDLQAQCEQAADHYKLVRQSLGGLQPIFIYRYPLPPVDDAGVKRALALLRTARAEEEAGLADLAKIEAQL